MQQLRNTNRAWEHGSEGGFVKRFALPRQREVVGTWGKRFRHNAIWMGAHRRTIERWLNRQADLSLAELRGRCQTELGITIGVNALWHQLRRMGLSSKKNDARRRAGPA